jgi:hypothetical protein
MNEQEQKAILTLSLMAAFADGTKAESERAEIKRIADTLAGEGSINLAALYQDVLLRRVSLPAAAASADDTGGAAARLRNGGLRLRRRRRAIGCPNSTSLPSCAAPWGSTSSNRQPIRGRRKRSPPCRSPAPRTPTAAAADTRRRRLRVDDERDRNGPGDPQRRDPQRRPRTAAGIAIDDGDHPAADETRLPHRQILRV